MKVRVAPKLTNSEVKAIHNELRRQCVEQVEQYEAELDVVVLYALNITFGFGKKRLQRFYDSMFDLRREMKERYATGEDENIGDFAMLVKLREKGIDVLKMYSEAQDKHKFKVRIK